MATKKYVSYDNLVEYNGLLQNEINSGDSETLESAKSYADTKLTESKTYADEIVSEKAQVQIITWEADD